MYNSLGKVLRLTSFGESHGKAIGGILDGFPAGILIEFDNIQSALDKRKPGQSKIVTQRKELDQVEFLSGIFEGKSTGMPIAFMIKNTNQKSKDYKHNINAFRPSHSDFTYQQKFNIRDYRGGGRSSARETANWVIAGALAKHLIPKIQINAYTSSVGHIELNTNYDKINFSKIENNSVRCPDDEVASKMIEEIKKTKKQGDTVGGIVSCVVKQMPIGLGEPIFNKLHASLAAAMLSINAVKGFEFGSGFKGATMYGSQHNDIFNEDGSTKTNNSGGIQGGISNGMDIHFRVAFKPVATTMLKQETIDIKHNMITIQGRGRHDPCVVPRAVPVVEALTAFVLSDFHLMNKLRTIN